MTNDEYKRKCRSIILSPGNKYMGAVVLTVPTLYTSIMMTAREPGWRVSGGMSSLYSGVPNSNEVLI